MSKENAAAVILAAGRGLRMKSDRAKVLHEILGRPMIHYAISAVRGAGLSRIVVVVGTQEELVRKAAGDGVAFARQEKQLGTGDAVRSAEKELAGRATEVVVLAGDAPLVTAGTIRALLEARRAEGAAATVLTCCIDDPRGYGRIARDSEGRFDRIVEDSDATEDQKRIQEVNSGTYAFDGRALFEALRELKPENAKGEYYLTDVLTVLKKKGRTVSTHRAPDPSEVYGVNSRQDLVVATNFLRWRVLNRHLDAGVSIPDPSTTYIEDGVTIGADTVIRPFSVIEHDVTIGAHCEVGPFAHLRPGTVLKDHAEIGNFVEVKNSEIGSHSKAKHLTYLGDATLGERVNIGAGTITANYDGKEKHRTRIGDGASTGSNTVLVAPVALGRGAKTGAGAVVLAGADVPAGAVAVGIPAKVRAEAARRLATNKARSASENRARAEGARHRRKETGVGR